LGVNLEFSRVNRTSESFVVGTSILAIGITKRVVDVLFRSVTTQALFGNLELFGGISMRQEGKNPDLRMLTDRASMLGACKAES